MFKKVRDGIQKEYINFHVTYEFSRIFPRKKIFFFYFRKLEKPKRMNHVFSNSTYDLQISFYSNWVNNGREYLENSIVLLEWPVFLNNLYIIIEKNLCCLRPKKKKITCNKVI